jgi:NADPH:quinone reductase-like Zn-dependent oxidoreductase
VAAPQLTGCAVAVDRPEVGDHEVLLRVHAAGVDRGLWHLVAGLPYPVRLMSYGVRAPRTACEAGRSPGASRRSARTWPRCRAFATVDRWLDGMDRVLRASLLFPFVGQKLRMLVNSENAKDLIVLTELIESGSVTPANRTYPLSETPAAIQYMQDGHARGKVVITV